MEGVPRYALADAATDQACSWATRTSPAVRLTIATIVSPVPKHKSISLSQALRPVDPAWAVESEPNPPSRRNMDP